jgi:hypothetical protein
VSTGTIYVVAVFVAVAAFFAIVAARTYIRYRRVRVVTCPETSRPAVVHVDAGHAALSAAWDRLDLRLETCSRWPERGRCGQPCISQIAAAPHDCQLRTILVKWYEGKRCAVCDRPVHLLAYQQQPGVLTREGEALDLATLQPEKLVASLNTYKPLCFDCLLVQQFREQHPELVIDRVS